MPRADDDRDGRREQRLDECEHDDAADEHRRRLDRPRQWAERGLERGDVGRRARHELPGTHAVVERERHPLEVFVQAAAEVVRDERGAFRRLELADRARHGADEAEPEHQRDEVARDDHAGRRRRRCRWPAARRGEWRAPRPGRRTRPRVRTRACAGARRRRTVRAGAPPVCALRPSASRASPPWRTYLTSASAPRRFSRDR